MARDDIRSTIVTLLRSRKVEIEKAIVARIRNIAPDSHGNNDVYYQEGQRAAVAAVLDFALAGIEEGEWQASLIPPAAIAQAHLAARTGVELGTILRRYYAAHAELTYFMTDVADSGGVSGYGAALRSLQRAQASLLDRLIVTINKEYLFERERVDRSPEQHRAERVRRLLNGELVDSTGLGYDLSTWHIGVVGRGLGVGQAIQAVATGLDCQLLRVVHDEQSAWAWLGGKRNLILGDVKRLLSIKWPSGLSLALGEPAESIDGWRDTHRQAQDAMLVSRCQPQTITTYSDVALLVPWLRDETRAKWLVETYLLPLDSNDDSGPKLRATLRAYFDTGHNASAAGELLNVTSRTIRNRLNLIKERLGSLFDERQAELELALRLDELQQRDLTTA